MPHCDGRAQRGFAGECPTEIGHVQNHVEIPPLIPWPFGPHVSGHTTDHTHAARNDHEAIAGCSVIEQPATDNYCVATSPPDFALIIVCETAPRIFNWCIHLCKPQADIAG